jgi:hypothetical protein
VLLSNFIGLAKASTRQMMPLGRFEQTPILTSVVIIKFLRSGYQQFWELKK